MNAVKGLISDAELAEIKANKYYPPVVQTLVYKLVAEIELLRHLVQVMDLAGGEAVRQRDEYAAEIDRLLK